MATKAKTKKSGSTIKKAATTRRSETKKNDTLKQIENLEKALEKVKDEDVTNLMPEDIRADIEANKDAVDALEEPKDINLEEEVKKVLSTTEPSEELKEQIKEFEDGKKEFSKKIEKEPEKTEEIVREEIKRVETIVKKVKAMKESLNDENKGVIRDEGFTNWWNGSSSLY